MALNAVSWDQNPELLAACIGQVPPGGATAYADAEPMGNSLSDLTDFIWGQQAWSETNLPDILYILEPSPEWNAYVGSARPPHKIGTDGEPMLEQYPKPNKHGVVRAQKVLDFKILPDRVSTKAPWWKLEAWRRLDPRVRWCDILMRMELGGRPSRNALNTECFRWRGKFTMISWHDTPTPGAASIKAEVLRTLTTAQRATNSTRGSTPGLVNPSLGEQGGRIPLPNPPRPVRRFGVPTATGNNANGQNNPTVPATGPPQAAGNPGSGHNPTALVTGAGTSQAGNSGFGHPNRPGIYDTNNQSLMIPQSITPGDVLGSSAMLRPSGPINTYGFPPSMPTGSNNQQAYRSSLAQCSQHAVSIGSGQRAAVDAFHESSASVHDIVGGPTSSIRIPSMDLSVLGVPASFRPFDGGDSYDQGCRFETPLYSILPGVSKRSHDTVESEMRYARTSKRPRFVENLSSPVLETPWSTASSLRTGPEVRHNGPATYSHGDFTGQTFTPDMRRHAQQYTPSPSVYDRSPEQTHSRPRYQEQWSEMSGISRNWDLTTKRHSDARASRSSTYFPLPTEGRESLQDHQGPNTSTSPSFGGFMNPADPAQTAGLEPALDNPRGSSYTWSSERGSRADFRGARDSTSHRIDATENDQQRVMHHPTDHTSWDSDMDAWLAADGGWDEFPMSVDSRSNALSQHDTCGSIQPEGVLSSIGQPTSLFTSATTRSGTISQHEELHNLPDTAFLDSCTQSGVPCPAIEVDNLQSH